MLQVQHHKGLWSQLFTYQWALRISTTTLVIPFLAVMFWHRATAAGCSVAMLSAMAVTIIWPFLGTGIDPVFPGMAVCLIFLVAISLMTGHSPQECARAVCWEDLPTAQGRATVSAGAGTLKAAASGS
ncbi:MAG: hypothetical protein ACU0BG_06930 [Paracoccus sp. (in: a-proteobacteria)]|uniref:hypothetical protein n=1 Tax=Paracoccus sp. TaxID=267 RepID=UPI003001697D